MLESCHVDSSLKTVGSAYPIQSDAIYSCNQTGSAVANLLHNGIDDTFAPVGAMSGAVGAAQIPRRWLPERFASAPLAREPRGALPWRRTEGNAVGVGRSGLSPWSHLQLATCVGSDTSGPKPIGRWYRRYVRIKLLSRVSVYQLRATLAVAPT